MGKGRGDELDQSLVLLHYLCFQQEGSGMAGIHSVSRGVEREGPSSRWGPLMSRVRPPLSRRGLSLVIWNGLSGAGGEGPLLSGGWSSDVWEVPYCLRVTQGSPLSSRVP